MVGQAKQIKPQPGPQEVFLSTPADIAGYGGQAGGGKSFALLLEATRHTANAGFGSVFFRRTLKMVKDEGGPWDESMKVFPYLGAAPNKSEHYWTFPSGASVSFAGCEHESDKYNWQSAQIGLLIFDELLHFLESQFWYLLSRNRTTCGIKTPYVRVACNPGPGWVKRLFAPWVDKSFPKPAKSGEIRWFRRENDKIVWLDGAPPARKPCDCLREGCPNCFPEEMSITFVKASVYDNRELLRVNPGYVTGLKNLDEIEKRRLLYGDWDAKPANLVLDAFDETKHVVSVRDIPKEWPRYVGADFGSLNTAEVAIAEELEWDAVTEEWGEPTGNLIVFGEDWPGHSRTFEAIASDIRTICKGNPRDGAGGNRTTEQGWRQAMRKEGIPIAEPEPQYTDPGLQYQCVNDAFRTGQLLVMENCAQLIDMAGRFQREIGDDGGILDKFDDQPFHLLAALRYIITKLRPPKSTVTTVTQRISTNGTYNREYSRVRQNRPWFEREEEDEDTAGE